MQRRLRLGQVAQCYVLLKKLRPSAVVSEHIPNSLTMQQLDNLCVTHQSQVTRRGLSYEVVFFSSAAVPGENFHCANSFVVVREEGPSEGLFDKYPDPNPPEIQNSTALTSDPGDPIEAGVFNASNRAEDISLVRNQGLEIDDDMEPPPKTVPLVYTPAADTRFEGQMWEWDGIGRHAVVSQNQNEPSFKNRWTPQRLSYIKIFLHCLPLKWLIIVLLPSTSMDMKESDIAPWGIFV